MGKNRRRKNPTRKEKKELTNEGICWKCDATLTKISNKLFICPNCKLEIQPNGI